MRYLIILALCLVAGLARAQEATPTPEPTPAQRPSLDPEVRGVRAVVELPTTGTVQVLAFDGTSTSTGAAVTGLGRTVARVTGLALAPTSYTVTVKVDGVAAVVASLRTVEPLTLLGVPEDFRATLEAEIAGLIADGTTRKAALRAARRAAIKWRNGQLAAERARIDGEAAAKKATLADVSAE